MIYTTENFIIYDEFSASNGFANLHIQKTLSTRSKHEVFIELKYLKRSELSDTKIEPKLHEGIR